MPANKDAKECLLPSPVQMSAGGLPPYTADGTEIAGYTSAPSTAARADWHSRAQNNILVSRTFESITRTRFIVDPNFQLSESLSQPLEWEQPSYSYSSLSWREKPKPNVSLAVTFGRIDAEVRLLPLAENIARVCQETGFACCQRVKKPYSILDDSLPACPVQSRLVVSTTTGDVAIRVDTGKLGPCAPRLSIRASSTLGQVAVFLPRNFHGPLTVTSSSGTPRLSAALARACAPVSEMGGAKRWFVGDLEAWHARAEHADEALVSSTFGRVWVGFEGEEADAKKALRWGARQWLAHGVLVILSLGLLRLVIALLFWFLHLVRII